MRSYLYIWHDVEHKVIVTSGIEFKDFLPLLSSKGGIIILDHKSQAVDHDFASGFDFVSAQNLSQIAAEDIYSWGNFVWADFETPYVPRITDEDIASLLFFSHAVKPLKDTELTSLKNSFLCYIHDDGWFMKVHYARWSDVEKFIAEVIPACLSSVDIAKLTTGDCAFWIQAGKSQVEEKTYDIDSILLRHP
jgi:hypothetical protein